MSKKRHTDPARHRPHRGESRQINADQHFMALLETSSLGTPEARRIRSSVPADVAEDVRRRRAERHPTEPSACRQPATTPANATLDTRQDNTGPKASQGRGRPAVADNKWLRWGVVPVAAALVLAVGVGDALVRSNLADSSNRAPSGDSTSAVPSSGSVSLATAGGQETLQVTSVTVAASNPPAGCNAVVTIVGTVHTNGRSGSISYQWVYGSNNTPVRLAAAASGRSTVQLPLTWTIRGQGTDNEVAELRVLKPEHVSASLVFTYSCGSPTGSQTAPTDDTVTIGPGAAGNPAAPQVQALLDRYFTAINTHNYRAYSSLLDAQEQQGYSESTFDSGYATVHDSAETLTGISDADGGALAATVSFTSRQNPADSIYYMACTVWTITLYLQPSASGGYLIGAPPSGYRPAYQSCP